MIVLQNGHPHRIETIAFSPDGSAVFAPTWQSIQVWRPHIAPDQPTVIGATHVSRFTIAPDGETVFAAGVELWKIDIPSGRMDPVPLSAGSGAYIALSTRGDVLVVGRNGFGGRFHVAAYSAGAALWEQSVGNWWWLPPLFRPGDAEFVRLSRESQGATLRLQIVTHAAKTGEELHRSDVFSEDLTDWVMSPDGLLVACLRSAWIRMYPLDKPFSKPVVALRSDNKKHFTGIAFHPSGRYLAATSNDKTVKLYDTATWEVSRTFTWNIGKMRSIAFSPDGTLAAAGSDTGKVVVWDLDL